MVFYCWQLNIQLTKCLRVNKEVLPLRTVLSTRLLLNVITDCKVNTTQNSPWSLSIHPQGGGKLSQSDHGGWRLHNEELYLLLSNNSMYFLEIPFRIFWDLDTFFSLDDFSFCCWHCASFAFRLLSFSRTFSRSFANKSKSNGLFSSVQLRK